MHINPKVYLILLFATFSLLSQTSPIAQEWTDKTSEEDRYNPISCGNKGMSGMRCRGGYCDNIELYCSRRRFGNAERQWSRWLWNSQFRDHHRCPRGMLITGVACRDFWCGKISVECTRLATRYTRYRRTIYRITDDCQTTDWLSEEGSGEMLFPRNWFPTEIEISGTYNDDKKFHICRVRGYNLPN